VRRFRENLAIVGDLSLSVTDRRLGVKSMIYDCTSCDESCERRCTRSVMMLGMA